MAEDTPSPKPKCNGSGATDLDAITIARLADMNPLDFDRERASAAERLGVRVSALDAAVKAHRSPAVAGNKQGGVLAIVPPDPWPESVEGSSLLDDLAAFFARHLALQTCTADALAAWALHTHVYASARHTPRLAITSPEKGCGKTTVLELLDLVVSKPLSAANISTAAVFRTIEATAPTLLVDEADSFLADNEELRGVLNAGHKRGGQVVRCVGDDAEPPTFAVFAPAAIAAIGRLPGTLADRSITITMRRATRQEQPAPIRRATEQEGASLARKAARWTADHAGVLQDADPLLPPALTNRVADNWCILFAIAEATGDTWPGRLAACAARLSADDGREGLGVALLRDVRGIFGDKERLPTKDIVRYLIELEDRPWPEISNGKPLTTAMFTRKVKPFRAERQQWRDGGERVWGFYAASFADAFARYLPDPTKNSGDVVTSEESRDCTTESEVVTDLQRHHSTNGTNLQKPASVTTSPLSPDGWHGEGPSKAIHGAPAARCPACGADAWWRLSAFSGGPGPWTCGKCAPPADKWIDSCGGEVRT